MTSFLVSNRLELMSSAKSLGILKYLNPQESALTKNWQNNGMYIK